MSMSERRVQILMLDPDLLVAMLNGAYRLSMDPPLPADARVVSVQADWASNAISLMIESATFPPVAPQEVAPRVGMGRLMILVPEPSDA